MKLLHCIALLGSCAALSSTGAQAAACDTQSVAALETMVSGSGTLCVTSDGLFGRLRVEHLTPGDAYTVWWVYFNDPASCVVPNECGPVDFEGDDPVSVFGRMDSIVAPASGIAQLSGKIRGMRPTPGSQVWFLVFGHGGADYSDGRRLARQLLTPEDPNVGAPHLGNWIDGPLGAPAAVASFDIN
jgi:hypothetical protein